MYASLCAASREVPPTLTCFRAVGCVLWPALAAPPSRRSLELLNNFFLLVFTVEAVLKLIATPKQYWRSWWNIFDLFIVVGSLVSLLLEAFTSVHLGAGITVLRTFRVGRMLRLVKRARSLNRLFETLLHTLPALGNIGSILFLLFFIYAVIGVQMFATVKLHGNLNDHANFQTFFMALLTLTRACTGESWNAVMNDIVHDAPGCDPVRCRLCSCCRCPVDAAAPLPRASSFYTLVSDSPTPWIKWKMTDSYVPMWLHVVAAPKRASVERVEEHVWLLVSEGLHSPQWMRVVDGVPILHVLHHHHFLRLPQPVRGRHYRGLQLLRVCIRCEWLGVPCRVCVCRCDC